MEKVAVFHSGELSVNVYYFIEQLSKKGISLDIYLYFPRKTNKAWFKKELVKKIEQLGQTTIYRCRLMDSCSIKISSLLGVAGIQVPALSSNFFLPRRTRHQFRAENYAYVVTVEQAALYWLYRTQKEALCKTIHYSLEIQKVSDPFFITPAFKKILEWEQKLLKKVHGLIIQDPFRAKALLGVEPEHTNLRIFYLPVSIPGKKIVNASCQYMHSLFKLEADEKLLLYFGANYPERHLATLATVFSRAQLKNWSLVLHGPDTFTGNLPRAQNIKYSNQVLPYDKLHQVICSATVGLALYDNNWANTRLTAFSSEKIARYLQAGIPFIAFKNESYLRLKKEFDCCELIEDMEDLPEALRLLERNYEAYRKNAYLAFEEFFSYEKTILPFTEYIKKEKNITEKSLALL